MMRINDYPLEVHFGLRLLDRAAVHAYCHNVPVLIRPGNGSTCSVGQVVRATL